MKIKSYTCAALLGIGILSLIGCNPSTRVETDTRVYQGISQGNNVEITEKQIKSNILYRRNDETHFEYSLRVDLQYDDCRTAIGTSDQHGRLTNIVLMDKFLSQSQLSPADFFKARADLEKAVIDVGNEEHKVSENVSTGSH